MLYFFPVLKHVLLPKTEEPVCFPIKEVNTIGLVLPRLRTLRWEKRREKGEGARART
jgi:hypothetical protein